MVATVLFPAVLPALLMPVPASAGGRDACRAGLPEAPVGQPGKHDRGFRARVAAGKLAVDVAAHRAAGGNGCLGASSADFNGDGGLDHALASSGRDGKAARLMVALQSGRTRRLHERADWATVRQRLYVEAVEPGVDARFSELDAPIEPPDGARGERATIPCRHPGVMLGAIEASGIVFCHMGGTWPHVWVSD